VTALRIAAAGGTLRGVETHTRQGIQGKSNRNRESVVSLVKNRFTELLREANTIGPGDLNCWAFCPGMRFGSTEKWWGDHGQRDFPHEGIDLCLYEDSNGQLLRLDAKTRIPVISDGVIRAIFKDYLGQAVIVEHEDAESRSGKYLSVYAHTRPIDGLRLGATVRAGDIIASIADTRHSRAKILPHLHLSIGRPSPDLAYENFVWNIMRDPGRVTLLNPMDAIDGPWRTFDTEDMDCAGL
jgi:murein DD-endopeptidase MepM/ murein hydrolase activator NlpD